MDAVVDVAVLEADAAADVEADQIPRDRRVELASPAVLSVRLSGLKIRES